VKASEARLQTFSTKIHCSRLNRYANCWGWIIKFMEGMLQTLEAFGSITIEMSMVQSVHCMGGVVGVICLMSVLVILVNPIMVLRAGFEPGRLR
jgi:hypothetical protein